MSKEKDLAKNTGILAIGTLGSKLFTFLLLPLYTTALATDDYGTIDVMLTFISLIIPVITLQLGTSMFRHVIMYDEEHDKKQVISTAVLMLGLSMIVSCGLIYLAALFINIPYIHVFVFASIMASLSNAVQQIPRALGHNTTYAFASFVTTCTSLALNVILILGFHWPGVSILIAYGCGHVVCLAIILFREKLWRWVSFRCFSRSKLKKMMQYALPLIPNEIAWWITNASDRFIILLILNASFNGIYAAAYKIPNIYITFFKVFNLAWVESVARNVNEPDAVPFINGVFHKTLRLLGSLALGIICVMSLMFPILIGSNYAAAYNHIYILMIATFFNSLCSMYGGIFSGFMDSKTISISTVIGAVVNVTVHLGLISFIGLYAASVSTLVSCIVTFAVCYFKAKRYITLTWSKSYLAQLVLMTGLVTGGYFLRSNLVNAVILAILVIWSVCQNREILMGSLSMVLKKRNSGK